MDKIDRNFVMSSLMEIERDSGNKSYNAAKARRDASNIERLLVRLDGKELSIGRSTYRISQTNRPEGKTPFGVGRSPPTRRSIYSRRMIRTARLDQRLNRKQRHQGTQDQHEDHSLLCHSNLLSKNDWRVNMLTFSGESVKMRSAFRQAYLRQASTGNTP